MLRHLCLIVMAVAQADAPADSLDHYIAAAMAKQHIPSLSLAVVQNGTVVKMQAYGLANLELNVPATPRSVYQLQSITKSFIACAIMLLVDDRKLGLDDKITKYLSGVPQAWNDITVRHLLTHTSGIPSFIQDQGGWQPMVAFGQTVGSSEAIVAWAAARPLRFAPGEGRRYSGTGYHVAGMIIEKVTGKRWGQFLHERIFAPLGMTSTRVANYEDVIPHRASGYDHFGEVPVNGYVFTPAYMESAAGGLVSTAEDMAKWAIALQNGTILGAAALAHMAVPVKLKNDSIAQDPAGTRHGLGWDLPSYGEHRIIAHGGDHVTGFTANFFHFMDDKLGIIVLTNGMPVNVGEITRTIAGFYISAP